MKITMKRTQVTSLGTLRSGVTYEVKPKSALQKEDLQTLLERGFAAEAVPAKAAARGAAAKAGG